MDTFVIDNNEIKLNKILNYLDKFALNTCKIIKNFFEYVIVGGFVSILFGRSRSTEDIDVIISPKTFSLDSMVEFYSKLIEEGYWVFNALDPKKGYEMLSNGYNLRIAEKDKVIPNIELKLAKSYLDFGFFKNKIKVSLNSGELYIGNMELNIAYKFYLGSIKDLEDAVYLYCIFDKYIDLEKIYTYADVLKVERKLLEEYLEC